ncbi:MAG: asparaginase [Anaerolineae bacterium]|nr:asparaginase [Anaerolineae bacterium]
MSKHPYVPLFEITRGQTLESIHFGAAAVVDSNGKLIASVGDPQVVTFMRSSAKPFQALPFIEAGGDKTYNLSAAEIALICSSHSGTDEHYLTAHNLQAKAGLDESQLMCGIHPPYDTATSNALTQRGEEPTANRHNCSGKHTGMLAYAQSQSWPLQNYLDQEHPVQRAILNSFAALCGLPPDQVSQGIDGCSAPNFAVPLYRAARAFALLADPSSLPQGRAAACHTIAQSMVSHPEMVGGPGRFDTQLIKAGNGKLVVKGGAEGYQCVGLLPGALGKDSPALGIAIKISDGDHKLRARPAVTIEVLRQLGALSPQQLSDLKDFGPAIPVYNWRKLVVGESHPCFTLERN